MGNKWLEGESSINPSDSGYRDIQRTHNEWRYVPSVMGMDIDLYHCDYAHPTDEHLLLDQFCEPLLPPLTEIPPSEISVRDRTNEVVTRLFADEDSSLPARLDRLPTANLIILTHGRILGLEPVHALRELLSPFAEIHDTVCAYGRDKRIVKHGLLLSRSGENFPLLREEIPTLLQRCLGKVQNLLLKNPSSQ